MNFVSFRYETENWKLPECRPFKNRIGFNFHTYSAVLLLKTAAQLRALKIISAKWESFGVKNRVNYMSFEGRVTVRNQRNFLSDDHMSYIIEHDCILQSLNIICWIQFFVSSYFGDRKVNWSKCVTKNWCWLAMVMKGHETFWRLKWPKYLPSPDIFWIRIKVKFKYYVLGFVVCSEIKGEFLYWNTGSRLSNLTVITEFADDAILDFTWTFQNDCSNMNFHN